MGKGQSVLRGRPLALEQQGAQFAERGWRAAPVQPFEHVGGGGQPVVFGVRKPQPVAQPLRVLGDFNAERGEAQQRVGRGRPRGLDRDQTLEAAGVRRAGDQRPEQSRLAALSDDVAGARRLEQLHQFRAHALARELARPSRSWMAARRPAASSGPAP